MTIDDIDRTAPAVLGLAAVGNDMRELAGGKAANLADMLAARFPVPGGFCVTTAAYRAAVSADELLDAIARTPAEDAERLGELAGQLREFILAAPMPPGLEGAIV